MDVIISALIEANKLLNKKDYYKALDCFECVLNINPTNNSASLRLTFNFSSYMFIKLMLSNDFK